MRVLAVGLMGAALLLAGCGPTPAHVVVQDFSSDSILDHFGRPATDTGRPSTGVALGEAQWTPATSERAWRYIVIHHSASERGSAAAFNAMHQARGWDELGYHFVIDNGHPEADGRVEVGPRWVKQKWGAHTGKTPQNAYNEYGIGICLVGDFTTHMPTSAQQDSLHRLVKFLMARYHIPAARVLTHRDAPGTKTECPGEVLHAYVHNVFKPELERR